jgi:hypothetical protein
MSSSPIQPAAEQLPDAASLVEVLKLVPDPRARRGIRHALPGIVAVALAAVVAGARSFAAIGQWAGELAGEQLAALGLARSNAPDASTLRKVFAHLDAATLDRLIGALLWTRTRVVGGRRVIAFDAENRPRCPHRHPGGPAPGIGARPRHRDRAGTVGDRGQEQRDPHRENASGGIRPDRCRGDRGCVVPTSA